MYQLFRHNVLNKIELRNMPTGKKLSKGKSPEVIIENIKGQHYKGEDDTNNYGYCPQDVFGDIQLSV